MDKYRENKQTRNLAVLSVFDENAEKIADFPALKTSVDDFRTVVSAVASQAQDAGSATAGKTKDKEDAEEAMFRVLMPVMGGLSAWARKNGDNAAYSASTVSESKLRRKRDTEQITDAGGLLKIAQDRVGKLKDYKITPDVLADLGQKIDAFAATIGTRESGVANRTALHTSIKALFADADDILEDISGMMESFKASEPKFYDEYFSAKQVKATGIRHKPPKNPPAQSQPGK